MLILPVSLQVGLGLYSAKVISPVVGSVVLVLAGVVLLVVCTSSVFVFVGVSVGSVNASKSVMLVPPLPPEPEPSPLNGSN